MTVASLEGIKKAFGDIYKIPSMKGKPFSEQLTHAIQFLSKDIEKSFGSLKYDGAKFVYSLGNYAGKDVTHF